MTPPSIVHYTGHRLPGLAPLAELRLANTIAARLLSLSILTAHGSLASGADILFAEQFLARGIRLRVWLPFGSERFKQSSVFPGWSARFDRALAEADSVCILNETGPAERGYAACSSAAMRAAQAEAVTGGFAALQVAVWNGISARGRAGTAADVAAWRALGLPSLVIDPMV